MNAIDRHVMAPLATWITSGQSWMLLHKHALHGLSMTRVLVGVAMLGILMANFTSRHVLWGSASFWAEPFRADSPFAPVTAFFADDSPAVFTVKYVLLMAVAAAVMVGWRTRLMTLLLAVGMAALVERGTPTGDQGDNIARIGLLLMVLMSTSDHWSLDARRRRRGMEKDKESPLSVWQRVRYSLPVLPSWLTSAIHNAALIALACQIFILYTASALFKVQGSTWQAGTALHYPLSLHEYAVFPALNALLTSNPIMLTALTYFSVYVQLFFAVGLLHPVTRRLALLGVIFLHGGIAVLMGLPWFSLAMLAFDAIFVSSSTYRGLERYLARALGSIRGRWSQRTSSESRDHEIRSRGAEASADEPKDPAAQGHESQKVRTR